MKKRPFWIIKHSVDYDGYNSYIDYIGKNYEAAWDRFLHIAEQIKNQYFYSNGVADPGDTIIPQENPKEWGKEIGHSVRRSINDDCDCWIGIELACVEMGSFVSNYIPRTNDWLRPTILNDMPANIEEQYKAKYPNSKY